MKTPPTHHLLARMLEESSLVARVRELDAPTLCRVVRHVGLEDAGEIIGLATTEQLRDVFDEDLWESDEPGQDEAFDADRFALWLEILLESGEAFVADKLTELPEEVVTLGFQRQVLVIDLDALAVEMADRHRDVDLVEKALESCLYEEIDAYRIIARRHEHWDAVVAVLLALDAQHHDYLQRLLESCCRASTEYVEENGGLYEVLSAEEMLESDAAAERGDRRAAAGYVAPSDAASFLGLPRVESVDDVLASEQRDPVTRAHLREVDAKPTAPRPSSPAAVDHVSRTRFTRMLQEAGVVQQAPVALLPKAADDPGEVFQRAVASLRPDHGDVYALRTGELAYLTNVLVAGSSFAGRAFRPVEAAQAAIAVCNLGLERQVRDADLDVCQLVREVPADRLFRVGWNLLFRRVSMPALELLQADVAKTRWRAVVQRAMEDQKPWQALPVLDRLDEHLDADRIKLLTHLLDRCPTLPAPHCGPGRREAFFATGASIDLARRAAGLGQPQN